MHRQLLLETIQSADLGEIIRGTLPGNSESERYLSWCTLQRAEYSVRNRHLHNAKIVDQLQR